MTRWLSAVVFLLWTAVLHGQTLPRTERERKGAEFYNQAIAAYSGGEYAKCIPLFLAADSLIGETPLVNRPKLRYTLALAYLKSSQAAPALKQFEWVAAQDSTFPYIYYQAAEAATLLKQNSRAIQYYRLALPAAKPEEKPLILSKIAALDYSQGHLEAALQSLDEAISLTALAGYLVQRGRILDDLAEKLDHAGDAEFNYEQAIRDNLITEERMLKAVELRERALADYNLAADDPELAAIAEKFIKRSQVILENDRKIINEIHYQLQNR